VGGKVVYAAGDYSSFDEGSVPPAMPDWSPVRDLDGHGVRVAKGADHQQALRRMAAAACDCTHDCNIHGHDHASAWSSSLPVGDLKGFWGAFGCSCWAV
jgi:hypothetical protein